MRYVDQGDQHRHQELSRSMTYKTRLRIVVLVNLGPCLVGKSHVLKIPPYISLTDFGKLWIQANTYRVSGYESKGDASSTSVIRFRVVRHPSGNNRRSGVYSSNHEEQSTVGDMLIFSTYVCELMSGLILEPRKSRWGSPRYIEYPMTVKSAVTIAGAARV
jgi:hypothetical protein